MLRHIVFWTFKDHAEGADKTTNVAQAQALLEGCANLVPGQRAFVVMTGEHPGCTADLALYSEFEDAAALAAYQSHPSHVAVGPFMKAVVQSRHCMDGLG
jgi:hypothetical protein